MLLLRSGCAHPAPAVACAQGCSLSSASGLSVSSTSGRADASCAGDAGHAPTGACAGHAPSCPALSAQAVQPELLERCCYTRMQLHTRLWHVQHSRAALRRWCRPSNTLFNPRLRPPQCLQNAHSCAALCFAGDAGRAAAALLAPAQGAQATAALHRPGHGARRVRPVRAGMRACPKNALVRVGRRVCHMAAKHCCH